MVILKNLSINMVKLSGWTLQLSITTIVALPSTIQIVPTKHWMIFLKHYKRIQTIQQFISIAETYFWIGLQSKSSKKHMKIIKEHLALIQIMQNYNMLEASHTKAKQKEAFWRQACKTKH